MTATPIVRHLVAVSTTAVSFNACAFFPFMTDDTGTQGTGNSQFEVTYTAIQQGQDVIDENGRIIDAENSVSHGHSVSYTFGVGQDVDVLAGAARQFTPVNGWQNTEIGAKWTFSGSQVDGCSFAVKPALILPVTQSMQARGLGNARTNWGITLISSHITATHELHLNASYESNHYQAGLVDPMRTGLWSVSVAPVLVLDERWKVGIDVGLQTNPSYDSHYTAFGQIGLQFTPIEGIQFGLGILASPAINAVTHTTSYAINAGLAVQF